MNAEDTLATRPPNPDPGHDSKLVSIDINTGASIDLPAGPGVKINPSPLPGNDVGYVRKDKADPGSGIYYVSGKRGPRGDIRTASWSPDGKQVVFHKRLCRESACAYESVHAQSELRIEPDGTIIPAFSPAGDRFVTNSRPSPNVVGASLLVTNVATGRTKAIYQDKNRNVLAAQWSPQGDKIIFSIGAFGAFFQGFHECVSEARGSC